MRSLRGQKYTLTSTVQGSNAKKPIIRMALLHSLNVSEREGNPGKYSCTSPPSKATAFVSSEICRTKQHRH